MGVRGEQSTPDRRRAVHVENQSSRTAGTSVHFLVVTSLTLFHLATFANKPPQVDDTLYLETARGILADPLRPLCNVYNWEGIPKPIYKYGANPPLYSYQQAAVILLFGWNLNALHVLSAGYVLLSGLAMASLARRFTFQPVPAVCLLMLSPTLLPGSNLMVDVPAMALVTATVAAWVKGVDNGSNRWLALASVMGTMAVLTKYNSGLVMPIVAFYSILSGRRRTILWAGAPVLGLALWCLHNHLYFPDGTIHFFDAQQRMRAGIRSPFVQMLHVLMCWGSAFFFLPALGIRQWLRGRKSLALAAGTLIGLFVVTDALLSYVSRTDTTALHRAASGLGNLLDTAWYHQPPEWMTQHWPERLIFLTNGMILFVYVVVRRSSAPPQAATVAGRAGIRDDLFLYAWVAGVSGSVCFFAPHQAPRYYYGAFPAFALLLARTGPTSATTSGRRITHLVVWGSIALQAVIGNVLAASDRAFAEASRRFAETVAEHPLTRGRRVFYLGHWGFQYFAQQHENFRAMDIRDPPPPVGDFLAFVEDTPGDNLPSWIFELSSATEEDTLSGVWHSSDGAGHPIRFRILTGSGESPHPMPLVTMSFADGALFYAACGVNRYLPYSRRTQPFHPAFLLQRVE